MVRDLRRLADTRFDVLVIGAGVYGAAIAWDAVDRGLSVALIDRGDFGGGTSFNSLKTLHGGLRSLQALNLEQMRRFIRERRALARLVPHLVRPLPFLIPTTRSPKRSRTLMRLALAINELVAHDRNEGVLDPALHLPAGHLVSRDEALRINPFIAPDGVTGGAVWHDYQMANADRVTFSFTLSAAEAGAVVANYVAAESFLMENDRVAGARVTDVRAGGSFDVQARVVVNAAGAWAPELAGTLPGGATSAAPRLSRAMNVVLQTPASSHACGGVVDGRFLFLVPWRGLSMLGTSHDVHEGPADALGCSTADLDKFLEEGRAAFPRAALARSDVRLVHRGLLPMVAGHGLHVKLLRESKVVDHAAHGAPGLISVHGVRYTTARHTAQDAVDAAFLSMGHATPPRCRTEHTPLFGGGMPSVAGLLKHINSHRHTDHVLPAALSRLVSTYGTEYARVLRLARETPALGAPLGRTCAITAAEIVYAARHEMALTLADALIRRTEAGSAGHPGADAVEAASALMAAEHGWDEARRRAEIASVDNFYRLTE